MDSGSITAVAATSFPYLKTFTCGFDLLVRVGHRARLRRARPGRGHVLPLQDRALRDGAEGRRHGALPAEARLAPRGAARRPELPELLRGAARVASSSRSCCPGPAATSSSAAIRGATTGPSSMTTSTTISTNITCSGSGWCRTTRERSRSSRRSGTTSQDVSTRDIFRDVFADTPRARDARGLRQSLALFRGQDLPPRPAGGRGQAEHGARPRDARARSSTTTSSISPCGCPVRLKLSNLEQGRPHRRERARAEAGARSSRRRSDGKQILRDVMNGYIPAGRRRRGEAGLLRARRELVQGRQHRLRASGR